MRKQYATTRYSKEAYDIFKTVAERHDITMIELFDKMAQFITITPQTTLRVLRVPPGNGAYKRLS